MRVDSLPLMSRSLNYRRDIRSIEQFKADILNKTSIECILLNKWIEEMKGYGHTVEIEDFGIDNTGKFVPLSDNRPDYCLYIDGKSYLYEIKQNTYSHRNSFKVYDLERYIEEQARILLFYGIEAEGRINDNTRWAIIQPESMTAMLRLPHIDSDSKWGFKPIVIIQSKDFDKYFVSRKFKYVSG
jgi:hypothetical protein